MPLTPADVHNVVFKKPPIGKRGYDEDEVDAFLDVVEAELARLIEENNELRALGGRAPREERPEPQAPVAAAAATGAGGSARSSRGARPPRARSSLFSSIRRASSASTTSR